MKFLTAASLSELDGIQHGFFTRQGGVSTGIYESLNCGGRDTGDLPGAVDENRARVARQLSIDPKHLMTLNQCHTADVVFIPLPHGRGQAFHQECAGEGVHESPSPVSLTLADPGSSPGQALSHKGEVIRPKADAMVTNKPGFGLGILTADCVPVLFADARAKVIGAAHAGWKGALGGVLENTIAAMESLGATRDNIHAAIGPCIHQPSYEVTSEFRDRFLETDQSLATYFQPANKPDHWQFDLPGFVGQRLQAASIGHIENLARDTYAEPEVFFSYRRTTHRGEPDYGRQISVISLFI